MASSRRVGVAAGIILVTVPACLAAMAPLALTATSPDRSAAARAAGWLAAEEPGAMSAGQQADVMVAMRITGTAPKALAPRLAALAKAAPGYATEAGRTAKVVLGVVAAGGNPRRLGGTDYVGRLQSQQSSPGRYGHTAFDQGLAMLALRAATGRVPAGAATTLTGLASSDGWNFGLDAAAAPDIDSTALSVVALSAAGTPCSATAIRRARAWIATQRTGTGWTAYPGSLPSANSTALVARSNIACGSSAAGPLALIRSLQQRSGAITFTRAQPENRLLATGESVPPLAGVSLAKGFRPG
ncbi:MAG: hypothetical protein FJW92_05530 [Actinobacteria bacterium]|nr:hypothetical protein [Actinomycetota bacterium]